MLGGYLDDVGVHGMKALLSLQVCCAAMCPAAGLGICRLCSLASPLT